MKFIGFLNGWSCAPGGWKRFLLKPFDVRKEVYGNTYYWHVIDIFGFIFWIKFKGSK